VSGVTVGLDTFAGLDSTLTIASGPTGAPQSPSLLQAFLGACEQANIVVQNNGLTGRPTWAPPLSRCTTGTPPNPSDYAAITTFQS